LLPVKHKWRSRGQHKTTLLFLSLFWVSVAAASSSLSSAAFVREEEEEEEKEEEEEEEEEAVCGFKAPEVSRHLASASAPWSPKPHLLKSSDVKDRA
jgi:hypothetical protein